MSHFELIQLLAQATYNSISSDVLFQCFNIDYANSSFDASRITKTFLHD